VSLPSLKSYRSHSFRAWFLHRPSSYALRAVLFLMLVFAVPMLVMANSRDTTWLPGFDDDADLDRLISHALGFESWFAIAVLLIIYVVLRLARSRGAGMHYAPARALGYRPGHRQSSSAMSVSCSRGTSPSAFLPSRPHRHSVLHLLPRA
jgi:hypothetical protein